MAGQPKFDPKKYLTAACEYPVGSEERIRVQQLRAVHIKPLFVEGDSTEAVPEFQGFKVKPYSGPRTGRILPGSKSSNRFDD